MDTDLLLRGAAIGFSIAAPVGPIGVLCIRRTLTQGRLSGLLSGLGAATADAIFGCIAAFGLGVVSRFLVDQQNALRLVGGLFLCYLGIKTLLIHPSNAEKTTLKNNGLVAAYLSTLFLTLTNPITILSFTAIFAGVGLASAAGSDFSAVTLVLGVFIGSALWWLLLSGGAGILRTRSNPANMRWINRISGLIITGFGVYALLSLLA